ncbi:MAG TPA: zf-HC2 domain-containing protein [Pyrinomonadaceae bacterium]|nr:zf-HC2 domain-containing protein [Pyrinomonadaceae bacterium]
MVNEFDKEIDAMLRDLAKQDSFVQTLPETHLDPDEISAFAENALPKKARVRITEHLADCSRCRKILANTVFLSSAEESEIIHEEVKTIVSIPAIPWYKQLFAFPNLAYTMGALALLLVGMVGLLVLQNSKNDEPMVAQADKSAKESGPNAGSLEGDNYGNQPYPANSAANTSSSATNTGGFANTASASNAPVSKDGMPTSSGTSANSNVSTLKTGEDNLVDKVTDDAPRAKKTDEPTDSDAKREEAKPSATPTTEDVTLSNEKGGERRDINKQTEVSQNQTQNIQNVSPDSGNVPRSRNAPSSPPSTSASGATVQEQNAERPEPKKASKKKEVAKDEGLVGGVSDTRSISGKTFRYANGVWTDSSYSGGSPKKVKRGPDDYKKLDSGLQNICNSLGGSVIIVWGGKNYWIQ